MHSLIEDLDVSDINRAKTLALAQDCGWLRIVVDQQDRVLQLAGLLAASCTVTSWQRYLQPFSDAVHGLFQMEERVLSPAICKMGLHAHAIIGAASRRRILGDLGLLGSRTRPEAEPLVRPLKSALAEHFERESTCSYRALARQQTSQANVSLTLSCRAMQDALAEGAGDAVAPLIRRASRRSP